MRRKPHLLLVLFAATLVPSVDGQETKKTGKGIDLGKKKKQTGSQRKKLSYSRVLAGTLYRFDSKTNKIFTFNVKVIDQKRLYDFNRWKQQTLVSIARQKNPVERQRQIARYQSDLIKRQAGLYVDKGVELQSVDEVIVRTMFPPVVYDNKGNLKEWTKKELAELRKKDKLPGYPATYDVLQKGQPLQVYIAGAKKKKKTKGIPGIEKPEEPIGPQYPRVVMIVVLRQSAPK